MDPRRTECLQALGSLGSFLPKQSRAELLQHAVETGVWGFLIDVLASEEELQVQVSVGGMAPAAPGGASP